MPKWHSLAESSRRDARTIVIQFLLVGCFSLWEIMGSPRDKGRQGYGYIQHTGERIIIYSFLSKKDTSLRSIRDIIVSGGALFFPEICPFSFLFKKDKNTYFFGFKLTATYSNIEDIALFSDCIPYLDDNLVTTKFKKIYPDNPNYKYRCAIKKE